MSAGCKITGAWFLCTVFKTNSRVYFIKWIYCRILESELFKCGRMKTVEVLI